MLQAITISFVIFTLLLERHLVSSVNTTKLPVPISVPPSQYWDGNDGPWSTFWTNIGTPPQTVRLLPSTSGNAIWPVLPQGCTPRDPSDCPDRRGTTFDPDQSSTWDQIGLYQLVLPEESALGYSGNSSFGFDDAKFGFPSDPLPSVTHQIIEGFATKDFYLGVIGLSPRAINLSSFDNSSASLVASLKDQGSIPTLSWAYTAGASYREPTAFGSLTLGGYDSTRFIPNNVSFPFGPAISRDLNVGLQTITTNISETPLLSEGIFSFLDSLVPHLWLPVPVCKTFENVFGLTYNSSTNIYHVNDTSHDRLVKDNPSVTFKLGPAQNGGETVDITMQYGSFDLVDKTPDAGNRTRYFPLRQAQNSTQYTLGRAFFQDAYIIADYERSNFSVSQAIFPTVSTSQQIVAIRPPGAQLAESKKTKLSTGAIAGIVVAAVALLATAATIIFWWLRNRSPRDDASIAELSGGDRVEISADSQVKVIASEMSLNEKHVHEMQAGHHQGQELPTPVSVTEMPSPVAEMDAEESTLGKRQKRQ